MEKEITSQVFMKRCFTWLLVVCLSVAAIWVGNNIVTKDFTLFDKENEETALATVVDIVDRSFEEIEYGETEKYSNTTITFTCLMKNSLHKDNIITACQIIDTMYGGSELMKEVEPGDKVMLFRINDINDGDAAWEFNDYYRFNKIIVLGIIFVILVLFIGRWKGLNTLLSLIFTFSFVFFVFVPSVMNGYNAYISVMVTCIYIIFMTSILINGTSEKTVATIVGCISGTAFAAIMTSVMSKILLLTGFLDDDSFYLINLDTEKPIDLTAIVFAAIVIGAMGAIMDVSMDISSSLLELNKHVDDMTFKTMFNSGMSIGRDIMGTMSNTLVLAYIGSSLTSIILLLTYSNSAMHLLNREVIIVEILQALIGSLAIMLTIPFTVISCGLLYPKKTKKA